MAAIDYSELATTAADLIGEAGSSGFILRTNVSEVGDSTKPWRVTDSAPGDVLAKAVIIAENGRVTLYLGAAGLGIVPDDNTQVVSPNGDVWAIKNGSITKLEPAGDGNVLLYTAELVEWPT